MQCCSVAASNQQEVFPVWEQEGFHFKCNLCVRALTHSMYLNGLYFYMETVFYRHYSKHWSCNKLWDVWCSVVQKEKKKKKENASGILDYSKEKKKITSEMLVNADHMLTDEARLKIWVNLHIRS